MNSILVTGGAGYVGSHTVHHLLQRGYDVEEIIVFDNFSSGNREFIPEGVFYCEGDLLRKDQINQVFKDHKITNVLHFAAYAYVGESMNLPGKYFENNLLGGINLLEAMIVNGCRNIIFSSSCAVYGTPQSCLITEQTATNPINPYGESKLMFERILDWYHRIYGLASLSLRYFNAAGAGYSIGEYHDPEPHLIPRIIKSALGLSPAFSIYGNDYDTVDGTCVRDFIHVIDLAEAHLKALEWLIDNNGCQIMNLGTGQGKTVLEIVSLLETISERKVPIRFGPRRLGDPSVLVADAEKAGITLNWKPEKNIAEILKSAWQWHKQDIDSRKYHPSSAL